MKTAEQITDDVIQNAYGEYAQEDACATIAHVLSVADEDTPHDIVDLIEQAARAAQEYLKHTADTSAEQIAEALTPTEDTTVYYAYERDNDQPLTAWQSEIREWLKQAAQRGMYAHGHDWTRDQVLAIAADYEADGSLAERNVERWATEITRQLHAGGYLNTVEVDE